MQTSHFMSAALPLLLTPMLAAAAVSITPLGGGTDSDADQALEVSEQARTGGWSTGSEAFGDAMAEAIESRRLQRLMAAAPGLDPQVLVRALQAQACAINSGDLAQKDRLTVIDYSRPSSERRMWVFDLASETLLFNELVAHGKNSGEKVAKKFSNAEGSLQTSLGVFRTGETYYGRFGRSLKLDGLEPGVNDNARDRAIVVHGSDYVSDAQVKKLGRISMSYGCPALDHAVAQGVIDEIAGGSMIFSWYPEQEWINSSAYLACGS